jgi:hypothetical protein
MPLGLGAAAVWKDNQRSKQKSDMQIFYEVQPWKKTWLKEKWNYFWTRFCVILYYVHIDRRSFVYCFLFFNRSHTMEHLKFSERAFLEEKERDERIKHIPNWSCNLNCTFLLAIAKNLIVLRYQLQVKYATSSVSCQECEWR